MRVLGLFAPSASMRFKTSDRVMSELAVFEQSRKAAFCQIAARLFVELAPVRDGA